MRSVGYDCKITKGDAFFMKHKIIPSILIMLCIFTSMLPASVSAAVSSIVMTGDITPVLGQELKFAAEPSHAPDDYTILQIWMVGKKMFTDSAMHNQALETEGQLLPKSERIFESGKSYGYTVAIFPGEAALSDNLTVNLNSLKLAKLNIELGKAYGITFCYDKKLHISSPNWQHNETEHWLACKDGDEYVFDDTIFTHNFNRDTYTCEACGYVVPESLTTKITKQPSDVTINCGDTLELSVEATGADLRYIWRWGDNHSITNSSGMKISGDISANLKIENFAGKFAEDYNGIYCLIEGVRGTEKTKIVNITPIHNNDVIEKIDGNGHSVKCSCGRIIKKSEPHTYVGDKCTKCGYQKGSTSTIFKSATLETPGFAHGKSIAASLETLQFEGFGIQSFSAEWLTSSNVPIQNGNFDASTSYILRIYPVFESNYSLSTGATATIYYNGKEESCAFINQNGKNCFNVRIGRPPENIKMTFEPNGGEGMQNPIYIDEYNEIYFPKCTFTKSGDEFFAWKVNGELKSPDPEKESPYRISKDTVATAIWKSQTTKTVEITMDPITDGKLPSEIAFSVPDSAKYKVNSAKWYVGDSVDSKRQIKTTALSTDKNYTVQLELASENGFGDYKDLSVLLNNTMITTVEKYGLRLLIVTVQILNDANVEFLEPAEGLPLASPEEIAANCDRFNVTADETFWSDESGKKTAAGTIADFGEKYYLTLSLKSKKESQIFGSNTFKINGTEYPIASRSTNAVNESIVLNIAFTAAYPQIKMSDNGDGHITVESPKAMNVTFAAVLYDSAGKMIKTVIKPDFALGKESKNIALTDIVGDENLATYLWRVNGEKVKIIALHSISSLSPICPALDYKTKI